MNELTPNNLPSVGLAELDSEQATVAELETLRAQTEQQVGAQEAAIFEAHQLIVQDPDLQAAI